MNKDKLDWKVKKYEGEADVSKYYDLKAGFFVDDYVLDKQCSMGRKMGKTTADFAKEGALVVNENKEWVNKKYRDAYIILGKEGAKEAHSCVRVGVLDTGRTH